MDIKNDTSGEWTISAVPIQWVIHLNGAQTEYFITRRIYNIGDDSEYSCALESLDDGFVKFKGTYQECFDYACYLITKDYKHTG